MMFKEIIRRSPRVMFAPLLVAMALLSLACANSEPTSGGGATSNANMGTGANPAAAPQPAAPVALEAREPERYSVTTTITVQPTGNAPRGNVPPLQFTFARVGTDNRRVSFKLPEPVGEVVYLEKGPQKYLVFPTRKQYVDLDPEELGFRLGNLMSPVSVIKRLKERAKYESMGTELVNGRTAVKYRFSGATDTHTKAGTVQADSLIYVDQETGLPLRSEIETASTSGAGARIVTETGSLELSPDPTLFEIPPGMKQVSSTELKQQVQGFVSTIRVLAGYLRPQADASQPSGN
jgi:hypothetical protein